MEVHLDVFPAPGEREARIGVTIKFEIGHTVDELGGLAGISNDFFEGFVIFDAGNKIVIEVDLLAELNPIIFVDLVELGEGGFAESFEIIVPDGSDGEFVVIPEFAGFLGAVGGFGGVARVDGFGFAVFVEEVGEPNFD